jgi:acetate kinase
MTLKTSMGLTPLAGLPGATRSGDIDPRWAYCCIKSVDCLTLFSIQPCVPLYQRGRELKSYKHKRYAHQYSKSSLESDSCRTALGITDHDFASKAEEILNKRSGWKALTGTADFSQIAVEDPPSEGHRLAFEIVVDRIIGFIGSYFVKLDGQVDALVFAGGIGEKSALLRRTVVEKCRCLGFTLDEGRNSVAAKYEDTVVDISKEPGKSPRVMICQTNEQVHVFTPLEL